jgi:two-component system, OmpR family, response regulator PrrA
MLPSDDAPGAGARILVVDDEADLVATYERLLRRRGYRVDAAGSKSAGLYIVQRILPNLVITDLRLPDGDGLDVVRAARALPPAPPVVVVTAYSSDTARQAALAAGASAFVAKPFSAANLAGLVDRLLREHAAGCRSGTRTSHQ